MTPKTLPVGKGASWKLCFQVWAEIWKTSPEII